jgi:hypothetical protein
MRLILAVSLAALSLPLAPAHAGPGGFGEPQRLERLERDTGSVLAVAGPTVLLNGPDGVRVRDTGAAASQRLDAAHALAGALATGPDGSRVAAWVRRPGAAGTPAASGPGEVLLATAPPGGPFGAPAPVGAGRDVAVAITTVGFTVLALDAGDRLVVRTRRPGADFSAPEALVAAPGATSEPTAWGDDAGRAVVTWATTTNGVTSRAIVRVDPNAPLGVPTSLGPSGRALAPLPNGGALVAIGDAVRRWAPDGTMSAPEAVPAAALAGAATLGDGSALVAAGLGTLSTHVLTKDAPPVTAPLGPAVGGFDRPPDVGLWSGGAATIVEHGGSGDSYAPFVQIRRRAGAGAPWTRPVIVLHAAADDVVTGVQPGDVTLVSTANGWLYVTRTSNAAGTRAPRLRLANAGAATPRRVRIGAQPDEAAAVTLTLRAGRRTLASQTTRVPAFAYAALRTTVPRRVRCGTRLTLRVTARDSERTTRTVRALRLRC